MDANGNSNDENVPFVGIKCSDAVTNTWTAVTLSLLTRWPHVQQLQRCLLYLYRCSVLQSLELWEERSVTLLAEHRASLNSRNDSIDIDDDGENISYLVLEPLQLSCQCVELLTMLCLESPVPIWGVFTLDLVLAEQPPTGSVTPSYSIMNKLSPTKKMSREGGFPGEKFETVVKFAQSPPEDLPICAYSLSNSLFRCLGCKGVLTLLSAALAESRILFFSSNASLLPAVCESLRILLYPLKWAHVYLPVVPAPLLDLVQAPVPFILGTLTKWMDLIPTECLCDVVLVDLDTGAIDNMTTGIDDIITPFPPKIEKWLLCALQHVITSDASLSSTFLPTNTSTSSEKNISFKQTVEIDTAIQLIVFDVMANLLRYVPGCIFSLNVGAYEGPSHHVFNRPFFLSECVNDESGPFLVQLTDTNAFEQFTESLYSPSMGFFLNALNALPLPPINPRGKTCSNTNRKGKKGVSHIGRDVFPLVFEETYPIENGNGSCYSFADPVVSSGDRLNPVKLPTVPVPVESVIVTAPSCPIPIQDLIIARSSSVSMAGMLVFPAVSLQVNKPFSVGIADNNSPRSTYSNSPKGGYSSVYLTNIITKMFPDWICVLARVIEEEEEENLTQYCIRTLTVRVIESYKSLLICGRERQRHLDQYPRVETGEFANYAGYQQGNIISSRSWAPNTEPFPVLSLALFSSQCRWSRASSDAELASGNASACGTFSSDSHDHESLKLPTKSPRLRALRNVSQLEKDLQVTDATPSSTAVTMTREKRNSIPMLPSSNNDSEKSTLLAASSKRSRTGSIIITTTSRTSTGGSVKCTSPSYISFLPLIGKPSAIIALSESQRLLVSGADSDTSSAPNSPAKLRTAYASSSAISVGPGGWPASLSPSPDSVPTTKPLLVRSHSYGRMRSSTFSMVSTRRDSATIKRIPLRRRHSAESVGVALALSSVPFPSSKKRLKLQILTAKKLLEQQESVLRIQGVPAKFQTSSLSYPKTSQSGLEVDIEEDINSSCQLCPPLKFDTDAFLIAAGRIDEWTAGELAIALKKPLKPILQMLKREAEAGLDPFSPWPSSSPANPSESTRSPFNVRSPNRRGSNRVAVGIGGAISDYLQFAFSGASMSTRQIDQLERRCVSALEDNTNRMRLVYLLRQTNKAGTSASTSPRPVIALHGLNMSESHLPPEQKLESQLFPLHASTFELLSRLYSLAVDACVCEKDYLAAYGLLGVGGLYFQIQQRQPKCSQSPRDQLLCRQRNVSPVIDDTEETEFLSERVCQHPIFQNPQLWLSVLRDRLSTNVSPMASSGEPRTYSSPEKAVKVEEKLMELDLFFSEAYALLFIINRLGVNFERAAAFNKMVTSEYGLVKGQYLQLQQYTDKLYGRSHDPFDDRPGLSPPRFGGDHKSGRTSSPFKVNGLRKGTSSFPLSGKSSTDGRGEDHMLMEATSSASHRHDIIDDTNTSTSFADLTLLLPMVLSVCQEESVSVLSSPSAISSSWVSSTTKASFSSLNIMNKSRSGPFRSPLKIIPTTLGSRGFGYTPQIDRFHFNDGTVAGTGTGMWTGRKPSWRGGADRDQNSYEGPTPRPRAGLITQKFRNYFGRKVVKGEIGDSNTDVEAMQPQSVHSISSVASIAPVDYKVNSPLSPLNRWSPASHVQDQGQGEVGVGITEYSRVILEVSDERKNL